MSTDVITKEQAQAIERKWQQEDQGLTLGEFMDTVQYGYDCLIVEWSGMWLCFESDGYCHS